MNRRDKKPLVPQLKGSLYWKNIYVGRLALNWDEVSDSSLKANNRRITGKHRIVFLHSCWNPRWPQHKAYSDVGFQNNNLNAQEPHLVMLSQECPDNVCFNPRKSDLEGWILPHVSSCAFNALGRQVYYKHRYNQVWMLERCSRLRLPLSGPCIHKRIKLINTIKFAVIANQAAIFHLRQRI